MRPIQLLTACALVCVASWSLRDAAAGELFAEPLTAENLSARRVAGPDAVAGIGDWSLGNGTLCAIVSDARHESVLSPRGGTLIDVAHCGRADDQFNVLQPLLNFARELAFPFSRIEPQVDARGARILAVGSLPGVSVEMVYAVDLERPSVLRLSTEITRTSEDGEAVFLFGDVALHSSRQMAPFTLSTTRPDLSVGFAHPPIDTDSSLSIMRAMVAGDLHVLVGEPALHPQISYGLWLRNATLIDTDGESHPLPMLAVNGANFSMIGVFARPFWIGSGEPPGLLELAQTLLMDLEVGERLVYEREILIGDRADVASVTDQVWRDAPLVRGRIDDPGAVLHVTRSDGAPATLVRPTGDGELRFRLPAGQYTYRADAPAGRTREGRFEVGQTPDSGTGGRARDADVDLGLLAVGAPARILLPAGAGPLRLVFRGVGDTPDPRFGDDLLDFSLGDARVASSIETGSVSLAGVEGDPTEVTVAPGRYRVLATRGLEYDVTEVEVTANAREVVELSIDPPARVLETPGWLSADLHVHSGASDDSGLPVRERIAAFVAQGADVVVATEHDRIFDYGPLIRELGLQTNLASVVGIELTSSTRSDEAPHTFGHANALPLPLQPSAYRGGAPDTEARRLRRAIADVRAFGGDRIVQLNHPRAGDPARVREGALFTHLAVVGEPFEPARPLDVAPNKALIERDPETGLRDLDFDAIELLNGADVSPYWIARGDWFSLLRQGEIRTATANSDSHRLRELVALPLNYVRMADDRVAAFDEAAFVRAILDGKLFGTTGPLVEVALAGEGDLRAGPGERFPADRGTLHVAVRAAPWVPVSEGRVYVDGDLRERFAIVAGEEKEIDLAFPADAFVTVEVEGEPGGLYADIAPGHTPLAFTNPVFVDADGDGAWDPPGLEPPLPATLTAPGP